MEALLPIPWARIVIEKNHHKLLKELADQFFLTPATLLIPTFARSIGTCRCQVHKIDTGYT